MYETLRLNVQIWKTLVFSIISTWKNEKVVSMGELCSFCLVWQRERVKLCSVKHQHLWTKANWGNELWCWINEKIYSSFFPLCIPSFLLTKKYQFRGCCMHYLSCRIQTKNSKSANHFFFTLRAYTHDSIAKIFILPTLLQHAWPKWFS